MPQKGDYTHLVNLLRLSSILKVVLFGGLLQQGFGRSSAQNRGLEGDVRLKSGEHLRLFLLL